MILSLALAVAQYPVVSLTVDAREITRGLFHVSEHFQAKPGPLVLWFPNWIPGGHSQGHPINSMIAFKVSAGGHTLAWKRDLVEMSQFTVNVPKGASEVKIEFTTTDQGGSAHLARVSWLGLLWYPAGPSDAITYRTQLIMPEGWHVATALPIASQTGNRVDFRPASLTRLIDSPAEMGEHFQRYDVTGTSTVKHYFDVLADTEEATHAPPKVLDCLRRTHEEMEAITGAHHYRDYHWLFTLSDKGAFDGLEHHESSEDGMGMNAYSTMPDLADLLCHEYFHSYNGKFRRPIGLCTPDYQKPMKDDLLWVYEGMTQFMGHLLACRAGWWTQEQWREQMALNYVEMNGHQGRTWRPLEDTAAGIPSGGRGDGWSSAHRTQDYYVEMTIIWLEVDMTIRRLTHGAKSITDFQKIFLGGPSNGPELKPYTLDDVCAALNKVVKNDWAGLLRTRIYDLQPVLSQKGFELAGWHMVYNDTPNTMMGAMYGSKGGLMLTTSIGAMISPDGTVSDVIPGMAVDKAGISPNMKIQTVNGEKYTEDVMKKAVQAGGAIKLAVTYKDEPRNVEVVYSGGIRWPHLERIPDTPDRLPDLLRPLAKD